MTVGSTEATTPTTTGNGLAVTDSSSTQDDKNMFLQLLVAQMKYQDPSSPADSTQFLTQSAQFSQLEKLDTLSQSISQLFSAQLAFGSSSLVGRSVSYQLADGTSGTGTVDTVDFGASGPVLHVGETEVPMANVLSVAAAGDSTSTSTSTTSA